MGSFCMTTSKAGMLAAFSESILAIVGQPILKDMNIILIHLVSRFQMHQVDNGNALNLLHICLPAALYAFFVTDIANRQYPQQS